MLRHRILKPNAIFLLVVATILSIHIFITTTAVNELLVAYDFPAGIAEPEHLTTMNGTGNLIARGTLFPIDAVHRQGLFHIGAWIWISDNDGKVLVLKRGPTVVTCPNSFSLLGEHTMMFESPDQTWRRAIREELGDAMLGHVKSVQQLPESPVYYFRDYGEHNSNRIDRQLTYLWWIKMDSSGAHLPIKPDAEIARHKWIETKTLQLWLNEARENLAKTGSVGNRLCHKTIVTLWEKVLKGVQEVETTRTTN